MAVGKGEEGNGNGDRDKGPLYTPALSCDRERWKRGTSGNDHICAWISSVLYMGHCSTPRRDVFVGLRTCD